MRHFLPGLLLIALPATPDFQANLDKIVKLIDKNPGTIIAILGVILFFVPWIVGDFLDAIRSIVFDYFLSKLNLFGAETMWEFIFYGEEEKIKNFDHYYYNYYALDVNFGIAILLFEFFWLVPGKLVGFIKYSIAVPFCLYVFILFLIAFIFLFDAYLLRCEMNELVGKYAKREK